MKIGFPRDVPPLQGVQPVGRPSAQATAEAGTPTTQGVQVRMSSAAQALDGTATLGDFDTQKVERVRQQIQDGSYQINAGAIADKLLFNAQEMLNAVAPKSNP